MTNKDELVKIVKEWININNEIQEMQKKIKLDKLKRQELSKLLISIMNENEVDCFDTHSGKLQCKKVKTKGAINSKYLTTTLSDYFKNDNDIDIIDIVSYINNNRVVKEESKLVIK